MEAAVSPEYLRDALANGLTYADIAEDLGMPESEVQLRVDTLRMTKAGREALGPIKRPPRLEDKPGFEAWPEIFLRAFEETHSLPASVQITNDQLEEPKLSSGIVYGRIRENKSTHDAAFAAKYHEIRLSKVAQIEENFTDRALTTDGPAWRILESHLPETYGKKVDINVTKKETIKLEIIRKQIVEQTSGLQLTGGPAGAIEGEYEVVNEQPSD